MRGGRYPRSKLNMHSTRLQQRRQAAIKLPQLTVVSGNVTTTGQKPSLAPSKPTSCRDRKRVSRREPGNKAGGRGTSASMQQVSREVLESLGAVKMKPKSSRQRKRTVTWPSIQYKLWLEVSSLPYGDLQKRVPCETRPPCRKDDRTTRKPGHRSGAQRPVSREHDSNLQAVRKETLCDSGREESQRLGLTQLPSRMGQNSLESYLKSYQTNGKFGSQKSVFTVNPLTYRPVSGLHCQLLELRTRTRCPTHQHLAAVAQHPNRKLQQAMYPSLSDTSPPPSPPSLNRACKVTTYVSCHPN